MMIDTQTKVILGIVGILMVVYAIDRYISDYLKQKKVTMDFNSELKDILTKDEYKVKGRYE